MRKNVILLIFAVILLIQTACSSKESANSEPPSVLDKSEAESSSKVSEHEDDECVKKIIFLNVVTDTTAAEEAGMSTNYLDSDYLPAEEDAVYAFTVYLKKYHGESFYPSDYPVQGENEAFEDYPFCSYNQKDLQPGSCNTGQFSFGLCAVAGTLEEINRVFHDTQPLDGWTCMVWAAPRPDLLDIMKEAGWNPEATPSVSVMEWYDYHFETIATFLGEENQVTMKIKMNRT